MIDDLFVWRPMIGAYLGVYSMHESSGSRI